MRPGGQAGGGAGVGAGSLLSTGTRWKNFPYQPLQRCSCSHRRFPTKWLVSSCCLNLLLLLACTSLQVINRSCFGSETLCQRRTHWPAEPWGRGRGVLGPGGHGGGGTQGAELFFRPGLVLSPAVRARKRPNVTVVCCCCCFYKILVVEQDQINFVFHFFSSILKTKQKPLSGEPVERTHSCVFHTSVGGNWM